jgi:hypothetical protein
VRLCYVLGKKKRNGIEAKGSNAHILKVISSPILSPAIPTRRMPVVLIKNPKVK